MQNHNDPEVLKLQRLTCQFLSIYDTFDLPEAMQFEAMVLGGRDPKLAVIEIHESVSDAGRADLHAQGMLYLDTHRHLLNKNIVYYGAQLHSKQSHPITTITIDRNSLAVITIWARTLRIVTMDYFLDEECT